MYKRQGQNIHLCFLQVIRTELLPRARNIYVRESCISRFCQIWRVSDIFQQQRCGCKDCPEPPCLCCKGKLFTMILYFFASKFWASNNICLNELTRLHCKGKYFPPTFHHCRLSIWKYYWLREVIQITNQQMISDSKKYQGKGTCLIFQEIVFFGVKKLFSLKICLLEKL